MPLATTFIRTNRHPLPTNRGIVLRHLLELVRFAYRGRKALAASLALQRLGFLHPGGLREMVGGSSLLQNGLHGCPSGRLRRTQTGGVEGQQVDLSLVGSRQLRLVALNQLRLLCGVQQSDILIDR